jgi:Kip1 ubiquitination-promoting complex protein 2
MSSLLKVFSGIRDSMKFWQSKSTLNDSSLLNLRIVSKKVGVLVITVPDNEIGLYVKQCAFNAALERADESISTSNFNEFLSNFKLLRMRNKQELDDTHSLSSLNVSNNEEFLLVTRKEYFNHELLIGQELVGPSDTTIYRKTTHLPKVNATPIYKVNWLLIHDDMRKVIVTLAQECAWLLATTVYANKLIMFYRQRIHNYIKHHDNAFSVMCQLGFPPDQVKFALKLKANSYRQALDWLIDNVKHDDEKSLTTDPSKSPRSSSISSNRRGSILSSSFESASNINESVDGLLEIVKFYSEKDEPVFEENIKNMIYMGFDVDEAREALRVTRNNVGAACAHLLGDKSPSIFELRNGISRTSEVYKKIVDEAKILLHLGTPQTFIFLVNTLKKPSQSLGWDMHSSFGDLMHHLVHLYHDEKHSVAVNQFNNSKIPLSALSAPLQV